LSEFLFSWLELSVSLHY